MNESDAVRYFVEWSRAISKMEEEAKTEPDIDTRYELEEEVYQAGSSFARCRFEFASVSNISFWPSDLRNGRHHEIRAVVRSRREKLLEDAGL